jgi:dTDP-4-amino-4,6-dideoxygalactose transaminase
MLQFLPRKKFGSLRGRRRSCHQKIELVEKIHMLRDHGQTKKYDHAMIGWNARMDGFQGAILSVKLKHLIVWNEAVDIMPGFMTKY